ncbi:hypothetical protein, partial [Sulfitobacter sp. DFL-23]|uniref:hypothetical protein n=1 Tax=Sulfitobacter sp. DFL-23 TaxID=215829 RepID=UPI001963E572
SDTASDAALCGALRPENRRPLPFSIMSNKFALSDVKSYAEKQFNVVLVSWVDSAEIASLVEGISI